MSKKRIFDEATEKWFREHPFAQTTVMTCGLCGLRYKPSLGHKCRKSNKCESSKEE